MDRLFKTLLSVHEVKVRYDDDFADRLSRQYTLFLCVFFSFVVSTKQFVGKPISCWCPAHFTESHRDYANTVCWVSNTYYVAIEDEIPSKEILSKETKRIGYYQWVPLLLLAQAVMFFVPCLVWRFLNKRGGIDIAAIVDAARVCQRASYSEMREKTIRYIVNQMDRYLLKQRDLRTGCCIRLKHALANYCCFVGGRYYGNYLTFSYLLIKFVYLANAVGQLFLLDLFMDTDFHMYGANVIRRLVTNEDWSESDRFPRVTLCDFEIRHQGRIHDYIIQCVLAINLFNEKIFIFVWFWFIFVALCTGVNFVRWTIRALYWPGEVTYIKKQLRSFETAKNRQNQALAKFTQFYLRRDGMFIIRLIGQNVDELVAAEAICGLWENYTPERRLLAEKSGKVKRAAGHDGGGGGGGTRTRKGDQTDDRTRHREVV